VTIRILVFRARAIQLYSSVGVNRSNKATKGFLEIRREKGGKGAWNAPKWEINESWPNGSSLGNDILYQGIFMCTIVRG
jgi:hypothetical protein